ncbi:hypothetical protein GE09DRAFT_1161099 [Coniochaeta sp. 2T2.1]|nr:hypothetical protein GE09DRAFT_1161099 [Coniochaeta sp. 2T2.1]
MRPIAVIAALGSWRFVLADQVEADDSDVEGDGAGNALERGGMYESRLSKGIEHEEHGQGLGCVVEIHVLGLPSFQG